MTRLSDSIFFVHPSKRSVGNDGENRAVLFLESRGYKIIARNWRTRFGEIDIIAQKSDLLVFAEVKTLPSGGLETLAHELNLRKQKRIIETSKFFLAKHRQYNNSKIRFDVLAIDVPELEPVYHIEDAFSELV
ncbi:MULTISPECIES: YraN family protein [unclassified Treponema]|uniref:YraN family protein n=1 Tax=unclassified Treponema TaxID=2638727 RepID=UPI0025DB01BC|nr:YraN family protein [Treponema sp. UBA7570]